MRRFEELLEELHAKLLEMSGLVQSAIREGVRVLGSGAESGMQPVFKRESNINRLEMEIDAIATSILALEQPVAGDLRFVTAASKINANLERIGDLAAHIAESSESLIQHPHPAIRTDIPKLGELVEALVEKAIEAFVNRDADSARAVLTAEDAVDALRDSALLDLIHEMKKNSESVEACVTLLLIARNLERIGDHATNIAEAVVFMIEGIDVRHRGSGRRNQSPAGS
ncbi:MAG: phosphate signaling complex protein PhoU [Terracidiphilus sp.]